MRHYSATAIGAISASLFCATSGSAEVTAAEVWQSWKTMSGNLGQTITGTESVSGDTLTVSDVVVSMEMPEATVRGDLDTIALRENSDGTVTVTMSPEYTLSITSGPAATEQVDMTMRLKQSGLEMVVDSDQDALSYALSAAQMTLETVEMTVEGAPVDMDMQAAISGLSGTYRLPQDGTGPIAAEGAADAVHVAMAGSDPENGGKVEMAYDLSDMNFSTLTQMVAGMDSSDPNAMLQAGFSTEGKFGYGATAFSMSGDDKGEQFQAAGRAQSGSASFAMNKESLSYSASQRGFEIALSGSEIPFPQITAQLAEADIAVVMPVSKSDAPQDFALLTSLKGLSVGNEIWSLFDPAGMLPHDPINLVVNLAGTGNWQVNIMDPAMAESLEKQPGELHSLTLKDMELSIAGASLTGKGAFTFDNTDLESFDGLPAPSGQANFMLTGGNKLLDTLVNMGLVPEDQAQGLRMMTGMFARPGEGEDTLVSDIEFTDDRHVMVNGMQMK
jgi:hypothetical protein